MRQGPVDAVRGMPVFWSNLFCAHKVKFKNVFECG